MLILLKWKSITSKTYISCITTEPWIVTKSEQGAEGDNLLHGRIFYPGISFLLCSPGMTILNRKYLILTIYMLFFSKIFKLWTNLIVWIGMGLGQEINNLGWTWFEFFLLALWYFTLISPCFVFSFFLLYFYCPLSETLK